MTRNEKRQLAKAKQALDLLDSITPSSPELERAQEAATGLYEALRPKPTAAERRDLL